MRFTRKTLQALILASFLLIFTQEKQTGYRFIHEYAKMADVNPELVEVNMTFGKFNRTTSSMNFTCVLKHDIVTYSDCILHITGYQFRSNEYRKGPMEFNVYCCASLNNEYFNLPNVISQAHFGKCPLRKNVVYTGINVSPNAEDYPPYLPQGKWMIEMKYFLQNRHASTVKWFLSVVKLNKD